MTTADLSGITTLLFDVMGTVVDDEGSLLHAVVGVTSEDFDSATASTAVAERVTALMAHVNAGERPWLSHRDLRREVLHGCVDEGVLPALDDGAFEELATLVERFEPWPDSPGAIETLRAAVTVVALSNADLTELAALSRAGGLAWHAVVSGQFAQRYKPDAAVYRSALDLLAAEPARTMLVASHPWDLRAAAEHGLATAYVARPGAERPTADDRFTVHVADLAELAELLARPV